MRNERKNKRKVIIRKMWEGKKQRENKERTIYGEGEYQEGKNGGVRNERKYERKEKKRGKLWGRGRDCKRGRKRENKEGTIYKEYQEGRNGEEV